MMNPSPSEYRLDWSLILVSRVGAGLTLAARGLWLLLALFPSVFGRLMMTNDAAGARAENAVMSSIMPGDSADGGALQAASRLCWSRDRANSHQKDKCRWQ
jgi:hypothetical protein